ncbi:MAG: hypothetical protein KL863_27660 [Rhizobium sp.]|nr:hypothetical protein [Rhizobium sp.]
MNLHSIHTPKPVSLAPLSILGTRLAQQPDAITPRSVTKPASAAPHIILVGRDDRDKAHASWFPETSAEAARRAAERMGMHAIAVTASIQEIADKLPAGKLFESGLAFVPFVKREVFDTLMADVPPEEQARVEQARLALASEKAAKKASEDSDGGDDIELPPLKPTQLPPDWSKIKVGSVVLASDRQSDGWWEALVEAEKDDNMLVLRWRQSPEMDPFLRKVDQVALLPTAYRGG